MNQSAGGEKDLDGGFDKDESDILNNQDETDPGTPNHDDKVMGAGPTNGFSGAETGEFVRGEVDVKEQMDRNARASNFPHRMPRRTP